VGIGYWMYQEKYPIRPRRSQSFPNDKYKKKEHYQSKTKKYVSLCCIIKNERYLEEFIVYHHLLNVEHFYIYDNESTIPISERLNFPYFKNICTIIPFPGKIQQLNAYNHCLATYGKDTEWMIFVDGDEYIYPKTTYGLDEFLRNYDDFHAFGVNWVMFGSSYYDRIQDGLLIEKYRWCDRAQNKHIKTICKPAFTKSFGSDPHTVILHDSSKYVDSHKNIINGPFNENFTVDLIQINHYYGRSAEEQIEKLKRGYPDQLGSPYVPNLHTTYNDVIDNNMDKYIEAVGHQMNLIRN
jgi:hypothetical protein